MHIVIDGTPAINDIRAIQRYAWNLIRELSLLESDNEFTALYLACTGRNLPKLEQRKFHLCRSSIPGKLLKLSWKIFSFPNAEYILKRRLDSFHFTGGIAYIPVKNGIILTTMHAFAQQMIPNLMDSSNRTQILKQLERTVSKSDYFITVSQTNKDELNKLWNVPMEKITAIPLGVGNEFKIINIDNEIRRKIRDKYALGDKDFILYIGAIEPHKNINGIIEAYAKLENNLKKQVNLVLVGAKTKYSGSYSELARMRGLAQNVIFVDYIQPGSDDLAYLYNMAKVFVFPSFYEGWASPPLEAMKCGIPALVSDIASLRESTGGFAEYCNPNDVDDIAKKLSRLLQDCEFRKMKIDAGRVFAEKHSWRLCAEKTIELYNKIGLHTKTF